MFRCDCRYFVFSSLRDWRRDRDKRDDHDEVCSVRSEGGSVRGFSRGRGRGRSRGRGRGRGNPSSMLIQQILGKKFENYAYNVAVFIF